MLDVCVQCDRDLAWQRIRAGLSDSSLENDLLSASFCLFPTLDGCGKGGGYVDQISIEVEVEFGFKLVANPKAVGVELVV